MFAPTLAVSTIGELHAALDSCAADQVGELTDAAIAEDLVELRRAADRVEAEFARRLAVFDRRKVCHREGAISTTSWLRHRCKLTGAAAAERVAMARHLAELPQTAAAFGRGELGYEHARVITRAAESIGDEAMKDAEHILVEAAERLDPQQLQIAADHLKHYLAPERTLRDADAEHERRALFISPLLDGFRIDGHFDREGGACVVAALEALLPPRAADDTRTPAQRRADALVELARQRMEAAHGRPHISLVVRSETLAGAAAAPGGELDRAGVVPGETALRIASDASLSIITVDRTGRLLDISGAARSIPPRLHRALAARDRGCRFPSCDRPPEWTDAHHIRHWARGGKTKAANLVLLCRRHHRLVHEGGWRLEWGEDGRLEAIPP
ncbi:MAG TPA: DUF222 domain-containing protein [Candidatus Dormibacteraeota bacterium]|jgi:hypothetical protein